LDLGVVRLANHYINIPIHVSTQASILNSHHAEIWKEMGAKRIVAARELSIDEVAQIKKKTGLEVEMFIHGAMCMAFSGHCSMSTLVAKRDSNRGGCIQNCRYKYTLHEKKTPRVPGHLLSSKDLCGIELVSRFLDFGIDSVKIEGRMKSNLYIASTVRAYANVISRFEHHQEPEIGYWLEELKKIPYRGYTQGSLQVPAGMDSVYNKSKEINSEYKMAGTVLDIDEKSSRFAFHVRNKLKIGDQLEVLTFDGNVRIVPIDKFINLAEKQLELAQPGNIIWLSCQNGIEINNVARIVAT
jgi:U32 family peptidase